ncbi:MAG: glycosyltransferase family 2 protein [Chitinophagales bacterium]|nr:glycosyltransferase family 2 protein [Chitinophagales bacterium]
MIFDKKLVIVMPAYNAAKTLEATLAAIPQGLVDELVLVDDSSSDDTSTVAKQLGVPHVIRHEKNKGYGGNQKTCYQKALSLDADIVIMLHPDYQYDPQLIPAMAHLVATGLYPCVLGSRILGNGALTGGMPLYKYFFNRAMTFVQNILQGQKLSEYHTGYRAFSKEVLTSISFMNNSDDFVFDNEMLSQIIMRDYKIGEISCPTKYFAEASSINFRRSVIYGMGCMRVAARHFLHKRGVWRSKLYV